MLNKFLAQASNISGRVSNPLPSQYGSIANSGLVNFFTNILRLFFVVAGVLALLNFLIAGFEYMNSAGDPKKLVAAWNRIWLSLVGLVIIVGSFALAGLFGQLIFGRWDFIINPVIYGPGD